MAVAKPDRVILFGSAARGTAGPPSDLDSLVIKRDITSRRRLAQAIYRALIGIRASIDVVVVTPEDVEALKDDVATIVGHARRPGGACRLSVRAPRIRASGCAGYAAIWPERLRDKSPQTSSSKTRASMRNLRCRTDRSLR